MGVQTGGGSLVIPIVLWGKNCPSHTVSTVTTTSDLSHIITGSQEGQLCVWEFNVSQNQITPKLLIYAHDGCVLNACTLVASTGDKKQIASSCENGEICLWDLADGRCVESTKSHYVHTNMKAHHFSIHHTQSLVCNGNYPEIKVLDIYSLTVMYSLVIKLQADWISSLTTIKHSKLQTDMILAITSSGTIKLWTLDELSTKKSRIYEDESKQIRCVEANALRCCPFNQRTVLIVSSKTWQIYDAVEFSMLCSESCPSGVRWTGGDFIALDKVCVWDSNGHAFLFLLPHNQPSRPPPINAKRANAEHSDYHTMVGTKASQQATASLYCRITPFESIQPSKTLTPVFELLPNPPGRGGGHVLVRADSTSLVQWWNIDKIPPTSGNDHLATLNSNTMSSLPKLWERAKPNGLLDQVHAYTGDENVQVTASLYIEQSGRLLAGQSNGVIVIIPVLQTVKALFLSNQHGKGRMPLHRMLVGHTARINCLLYPHALEARYSPNHLLSGSSDFTVKLWDLSLGQIIHSFAQHAGEVTQFYLPPPQCNMRIQSCVCTVASDHSVALLSLKELRPLVFASRHMFPVECVKWRPLEDFLVVSCTDSTAYVWQMETGLLDRVVHGVTAVEILKACDEAQKIQTESNDNNPQITITQALKRRNLASFKNLAQQTINSIEQMVEEEDITETPDSFVNIRTTPLVVTGLKSVNSDAEIHVLLFDTEALIVQLLCEEFGFPAAEYLAATQSQSKEGGQDVGKKFDDFLSLVKEKAEGLASNLSGSRHDRPSSRNSPRGNTLTRRGSADSASSRDSDRTNDSRCETQSMDIAQLYISLLHAWGLDKDLDKLCLQKLGLERAAGALSYGMLTSGGKLVLMLPKQDDCPSNSHSVDEKYPEAIIDSSCKDKYWELSNSLTTQHLLSVISLANTLMSMKHATFVKQKSQRKQAVSSLSHPDEAGQSQSKQGWSLLAALHCVLLPDLVDADQYRPPQLHMLANRWQDRCLEVREASQALLLGELRRIRSGGRRLVINEWAPHMPDLIEDHSGGLLLADTSEPQSNGGDPDVALVRAATSYTEKRKLEATAIVLLGVIGAEFGSEFDETKHTRGRGGADGFGLTNNSLAWHTSRALSLLLLNPANCRLPPHAAIRRAAIDLLGRGFTVWQPYIDVSAVLLGLLEICIDADKVIPSTQSGLPLTPAADACRTARHALSLIATARPATFLTCIAKEVARYNSATQNAQSGTAVSASVLVKAKSEILRVIELLIEKQPNDVADLLVETMDVAVHCLDPTSLKTKGLQETFPALCRFAMVAYCTTTRRICVGSKNGSLAFYELKQSKSQSIPFQASPTTGMILYLKASSKETIRAHKSSVAAVCFSPEGKFLASYSPVDSKVCVWQTSSSSLFSLGAQHTKCVKSYSVPWKNPGPPQINATRGGRLHWVDARTISLMLPDGSESKYRI